MVPSTASRKIDARILTHRGVSARSTGSPAFWSEAVGSSQYGRFRGLSGLSVVTVPSSSVLTTSRGTQVRDDGLNVRSITPGPVNTSSGPISVAQATITMNRLVAPTRSTVRAAGGKARNARMARPYASGARHARDVLVQRMGLKGSVPPDEVQTADAAVLLGVAELVGQVADAVRTGERSQGRGSTACRGRCRRRRGRRCRSHRARPVSRCRPGASSRWGRCRG